VLSGGPVGVERGFVLHGPEYPATSSRQSPRAAVPITRSLRWAMRDGAPASSRKKCWRIRG
jgi:putative AlgH/UPF0301 family transcriptional regulator